MAAIRSVAARLSTSVPFQRIWQERAHLRAPCNRPAQDLVCRDGQPRQAMSPFLFPTDGTARNRAHHFSKFPLRQSPLENLRSARATGKQLLELAFPLTPGIEIVRQNIRRRVQHGQQDRSHRRTRHRDDIAMPEEDGVELAAQIEADWTLHGVPIVFLTGLVTRDEARGG